MAMKNKKLVSDIAIDGLFIALILVLSPVSYTHLKKYLMNT